MSSFSTSVTAHRVSLEKLYSWRTKNNSNRRLNLIFEIYWKKKHWTVVGSQGRILSPIFEREYPIENMVLPFDYVAVFNEEVLQYYLLRRFSSSSSNIPFQQLLALIPGVMQFAREEIRYAEETGRSELRIVMEIGILTLGLHGIDEDEILLNQSACVHVETTGLEIELYDGKDSKGDCMICLDEFFVGKEIVRMPCSHSFHLPCIIRWLHEANTCPVCRFKMEI